MAEALGGFYPGGVENPHVHVVSLENGYMIEPIRGETDAAISYIPEHPTASEGVVERAGGMALAKTLADVYEL